MRVTLFSSLFRVFSFLFFFFDSVRKRTKESSRAVGGDWNRLDTRQKNFNDSGEYTNERTHFLFLLIIAKRSKIPTTLI